MATAEASPNRRPAGDLRAYERRVYSQNGEDGILEEILHRLGRSSGGFFVEFGAGEGTECNCARLALEEGWAGLFMEADAAAFAKLGARYATRPGVRCVNALVTSRNVERLLRDNGVPSIFDVLSIDIDGNDYWVWAKITRWRPRIVVIEYNAAHPPPRAWVMKENPLHVWNGTTYFGASLTSLARLGSTKGYALVGTESAGVNAFFVREDLASEEAFVLAPVQDLYTPPGYGPEGKGHPPGAGPYEEL